MDLKDANPPLEKTLSYKECPRVVEKTREPAFFWLEPGVGVILLGTLVEPDKFKDIIRWVFSLTGGIWLASVKGRPAKALSLALVLSALRPFGETRYIRFLFGMATVMRVLRVIEAVNSPQAFEERGAMYTIKYSYLFVSRLLIYVQMERTDRKCAQHDLRRASCFDTKEEQQVAESKAIRDVAAHSFGIAFMSAILRQPFILRNWFLISTVNMLRFFHFISMAEAGYRLHLAKFGIRAPACFDNPWKSETVAEFWSKRWNMVIATQLRNVFYKPVVQWTNSKFKGALSVFAASSALHMIPVVSLGGSKAAIASTALFFLMQPALIWFESTLKLKGKAWVNLAMWSTAPLFSLPLYTVL